jgi:hypothetical protein
MKSSTKHVVIKIVFADQPQEQGLCYFSALPGVLYLESGK